MSRARAFFRRVQRWLSPPRQLRPTRTGWFFLVGVVSLGIAAVNTGNNLLYFVLGMFLAAIVVSGILSERNLRFLEIEREPAGNATAGSPVAMAYLVSRRAGRIPGFALTLRDRDPESGEKGEEVRVPRIDPAASRRRLYSRTFPKRGVHRISEVEVGTAYPFGLFRKSRRLDIESVVRVRPRVPEISVAEVLGGREEGVSATLSRGDGLDLFGLRDHDSGDDARRIHWKASARAGKVVVKDPAREEPPQVVLRLVLEGEEATIEAAVERTAGLAAALLRDGFGVGLIAGGIWVPPSAQARTLDAILDALVDVGPGAQAAEHEIPRGAGVITISSAISPISEAA